MTKLMEQKNVHIDSYKVSPKAVNEVLKTIEYPTSRKLSRSTKISIVNMRNKRRSLTNATTTA